MTQPQYQDKEYIVPWWVHRMCADETPMRTFMVVGGLGAAKSHNSQLWDIWKCLQNGVPKSEPKPSKSWTVAPSYRICETLVDLTLQVAADADVYGMVEGVTLQTSSNLSENHRLIQDGLNQQQIFFSAGLGVHHALAVIESGSKQAHRLQETDGAVARQAMKTVAIAGRFRAGKDRRLVLRPCGVHRGRKRRR